MLVHDLLYPALDTPPSTLCCKDQYAFRPRGSTTVALVALLHSVTKALETNPCVVIVALDFSKAFDTVRRVQVERTSTGALRVTHLRAMSFNLMIQTEMGHIVIYMTPTTVQGRKDTQSTPTTAMDRNVT